MIIINQHCHERKIDGCILPCYLRKKSARENLPSGLPSGIFLNMPSGCLPDLPDMTSGLDLLDSFWMTSILVSVWCTNVVVNMIVHHSSRRRVEDSGRHAEYTRKTCGSHSEGLTQGGPTIFATPAVSALRSGTFEWYLAIAPAAVLLLIRFSLR